MWHSGHELKHKTFWLALLTAVQHWSSLLGEIVPSLSLKVFKIQLDKYLSSLVWPQFCLCLEQKVGPERSWSPWIPAWIILQCYGLDISEPFVILLQCHIGKKVKNIEGWKDNLLVVVRSLTWEIHTVFRSSST